MLVDDVPEQLHRIFKVVVVVEDPRLAVLDLHQLRRVGHVLDVGVESRDHLLLASGNLTRLHVLLVFVRHGP